MNNVHQEIPKEDTISRIELSMLVKQYTGVSFVWTGVVLAIVQKA